MSPRPDLGDRIACHNCTAKYYTLNRSEPACPSCGTAPIDRDVDPVQAAMNAVPDLPRPKAVEEEPEPAPPKAENADSDEDEDEDEEEEFGGELNDLDFKADEEEK